MSLLDRWSERGQRPRGSLSANSRSAKLTIDSEKHDAFERPVAARWIALILLAFAYPIVYSAREKGLYFDDPYILMRYGEHLANGAGWEFNPASHTNNSVTSPLYVLLIAAGTFIGGPAEAWSLCIYVAAWGLGGVLLGRIFFRDGRRLAG